MSHRTQEQDMGGLTSSQINFLDCARVYDDAAEYQDGLIPHCDTAWDQRLIIQARDYLKAQAKRYRELAE